MTTTTPIFIAALAEKNGWSGKVTRALWRALEREGDSVLTFYLNQAQTAAGHPPRDKTLRSSTAMLMTKLLPPARLVGVLERLAEADVLSWREANQAMEALLARLDQHGRYR